MSGTIDRNSPFIQSFVGSDRQTTYPNVPATLVVILASALPSEHHRASPKSDTCASSENALRAHAPALMEKAKLIDTSKSLVIVKVRRVWVDRPS